MSKHIWVICRKEQVDSRKTLTVTEFGHGWFNNHKSAQAVIDGQTDGVERYVMSIPNAEEIEMYQKQLTNS